MQHYAWVFYKDIPTQYPSDITGKNNEGLFKNVRPAEASNYIFIKLDNFFMPCKMPFRCTTKAIAGFYEGKQC
jgi:hypothetical protein